MPVTANPAPLVGPEPPGIDYGEAVIRDARRLLVEAPANSEYSNGAVAFSLVPGLLAAADAAQEREARLLAAIAALQAELDDVRALVDRTAEWDRNALQRILVAFAGAEICTPEKGYPNWGHVLPTIDDACRKIKRLKAEVADLRATCASLQYGDGGHAPIDLEWKQRGDVLIAEINALPEPVRSYVHDLETRADPTGDIQRLHALAEHVRGLETTDVAEQKVLEAALEWDETEAYSSAETEAENRLHHTITDLRIIRGAAYRLACEKGETP